MREAALKALEMKQAVDVCAEYHADEVRVSARGSECSCQLKSAMRNTSLTEIELDSPCDQKRTNAL